MSIMEHLSENYDEYFKIAKKITGGKEPGNLLNSCIILINDKYKKSSIEKALKEGYIKWWIIKVMKLEYISNNSWFHRKYRSIYVNEIYDNSFSVDELDYENFDYQNKIKKILYEELYHILKNKSVEPWQFDCFLLKHYDEMTYREISSEVDIALSSVYAGITKVYKLLKKNITTKYKDIDCI